LLGATYAADWPTHVDLRGMAGFALVLAAPDRMTTWVYDGVQLTSHEHAPGTHMVTSGGAEDGTAARFRPDFSEAAFPEEWQQLLRTTTPRDDPASLVVHHESEGKTFATVFGEFLDVRPGRLEVTFSRTPWGTGPWQRLDAG
jgi:hypothetical protein